MHEDVRNQLNAYLDSELHGTRLQEMKLHLASCDACRHELQDLRFVSELLQAAPVPEFMPAERFASNLAMRLPRRTSTDLPPKQGSLAWWLVLAGLLGAWFFVQTVFTVTGLVEAADTTGLLGQAATWFGSGLHQAAWFAATAGLFGRSTDGLQSTLSMLNGLDIFGVNLLKGFLWQALIVLLYWCWLFAWWLGRRPRIMQLDKT
jgi:anti-sigma factor RsiW